MRINVSLYVADFVFFSFVFLMPIVDDDNNKQDKDERGDEHGPEAAAAVDEAEGEVGSSAGVAAKAEEANKRQYESETHVETEMCVCPRYYVELG